MQHKNKVRLLKISICLVVLIFLASFIKVKITKWQSKFVTINKDGMLVYHPDSLGNILPDFSRVGYKEGGVAFPDLKVVKTVYPAASGSSQKIIQDAIDEVARLKPDNEGFRGAILLKKGTYKIEGTIYIKASGIVLRGEGEGNNNGNGGTRLIATGTKQRNLIEVTGSGKIQKVSGKEAAIIDDFVAVGAKSFRVTSTKKFKKGDSVILFRPGTAKWIHDLKMDQIVVRRGTKQWVPEYYNLEYERVITDIKGNRLFLDNPVVMQMETKYGGGSIYGYHFNGRIEKVGIESLYLESAYANDTAENHGWVAIRMDKVENCWVNHVTSRYFGYSCVSLGYGARNTTVMNASCLDAKSIITGSRRYSFNNDGQLNLFMDCRTTEGRHDYVTGAKVCGPNVFYNSTAERTHADIGPHHRWATGTLYDNIQTTGQIDIQDRGNWGSGHGWSGVNQILWNCKGGSVVVQDPWVSGHNYCIGLIGHEGKPRFKGRNEGVWEGLNRLGLQPKSLYMAQLKQRLNR